jgi:septal ring factor EnvC (AmiA/AmiB activator)
MGDEPALKAEHVGVAWAALALALALALPAAAGNGEAVKHALVRVTKIDGRITEKSLPLEKATDRVYRLKSPIKDITRDINTIDIIYADASACKGEAGYFVVSTGVLGTFREDKGRLEERRNPCRSSG